jgi:predicted transcriptional regulator
MKLVAFRIDKELFDKLKALALKQERSISFIIRKAIQEYIKK